MSPSLGTMSHMAHFPHTVCFCSPVLSWCRPHSLSSFACRLLVICTSLFSVLVPSKGKWNWLQSILQKLSFACLTRRFREKKKKNLKAISRIWPLIMTWLYLRRQRSNDARSHLVQAVHTREPGRCHGSSLGSHPTSCYWCLQVNLAKWYW